VPIGSEEREEPLRCVILLDRALRAGRAANAAAVIALTLGKRHPEIVGADLIDASGERHPGLIPIGIAVLGAPTEELPGVRRKALAAGIDVVGFPAPGQETTDYARFAAHVAGTRADALTYIGVGLLGPRKPVSRIVGRFFLLP
jgi:hypothetical protein